MPQRGDLAAQLPGAAAGARRGQRRLQALRIAAHVHELLFQGGVLLDQHAVFSQDAGRVGGRLVRQDLRTMKEAGLLCVCRYDRHAVTGQQAGWLKGRFVHLDLQRPGGSMLWSCQRYRERSSGVQARWYGGTLPPPRVKRSAPTVA